jgi:GNAT superfamily N-acetyltransferase
MKKRVTTTYLEMADRRQHQPARTPAIHFELSRVAAPSPALGRFLYTAIGAPWHWYDRLCWDEEQWRAWLERPGLETWIACVAGTPAGYFELNLRDGGDVEIAYFGVMANMTGKGLGGALLSAAVSRAWDMGGTRVWVHTCTLDHPHALRNYEARGFRAYRSEDEEDDISGRWRNAFTANRQTETEDES